MTKLVGTSITLSALAEAGVCEFKLTKEDVVDLLVSEATSSVEAEIAEHKAENERITEARKARLVSTREAIKAWYATQPIGAAFISAFEGKEILCSSGCLHVDVDSLHLGSPCSKTIARLGLEVPSELYDEEQSCLYPANDDPGYKRYHKLQALERKLDEVEHSSKKLKTQLVRKILAASESGVDVLANIKSLSQDFLGAVMVAKAQE